jgi:hypothetical protein
MSPDSNLAQLGRPRRVWAVAAARGPVDRLRRVHVAIAERFAPGDRLLYSGDYLGDLRSAEIVDELLAFRAYLLARPGLIAGDFVYLRGAQEEIWSKLLQIQYAPDPSGVLRWMLERGAAETITAYGGRPDEGIYAAREGALAMARWTNVLRAAMRRRAGHDKLMSVLSRAAVTGPDGAGELLFVHAGLSPSRKLADQGDSFWWGAAGFERIQAPYEGFKRVFRGADPGGGGPLLDGYAVTLCAGPRDAAPLFAAAVGPEGEILELVTS